MSILSKLHSYRWSIVIAVIFALFMDYFLYGLVMPIITISTAHASVEKQLGFLYACYATGVIIATFLFGLSGDRSGYRRLMIYGVILSILATLTFSFSSNFYLLSIARFLQGASAAASWTAGLSLIAENYVQKRLQMMSLVLMGSTVGSILGPLAGGILYELGGYILPFIIAGCLLFVDINLRIFLLPKDKSKNTSNEIPALLKLICKKTIFIPALTVALAAMSWGIIEPIFPVQLNNLGVSPGFIGVIFTISTIIYGFSAPLVNWLANKLTISNVIVLGTFAMAICLPWLGFFQNVYLSSGMLFLTSICYALMFNPTSTALADAVDQLGLSCYSATYAIYNIAYSVGQMLASVFDSIAALRMNHFHILLCISILLIIFTPFMLLKSFLSVDY